MNFDNTVLEILEEAKCTGPTKKTSSTRKGKKWTKCARQPDGSYKRIHWGQKGVKVTGKSGNTKRKKAFRARHKCSKAKPGSPQAAACKDWLIILSSILSPQLFYNLGAVLIYL